ncbi:MAG: radical SAM protein [Polaromonas sp.]|nr:radical SAM protein [Polaromonas sp.]
MLVERLSIELTNRCDKGCGFCYNHSGLDGATLWRVEEVLTFVRDCVHHGVKAVSFGGGEPLLYPGLGELLEALQGQVFRSVTTNGLLLTQAEHFSRLVAAKPDKVHLSIHRPASMTEVSRVMATVQELQAAGIASGVNLLVPADQVEAATRAAQALRAGGIDNQRIVYLPQRGSHTPTAKVIAAVAAGPFQSMSCLTACGSSPRFCAISWDRAAAWCSYTSMKRPLPELTHAGLMAALDGLGIVNCATTAGVEQKPVSWRNKAIETQIPEEK